MAINFLISLWSRFLQLVVKSLAILTGKGGGKFAKLLPPNQHYLVTNYCGIYKFNVDTTYPMESAVWLSGVYEVVTTKFLQKVLQQGDVFLDIGANCGAVTLVAASAIANGKIYAFEPGLVRSRLQANIDLNPALRDIVQVVPFGLGFQTGQLLYQEDENYRGNGALVNSCGIPVDVISLDEWVARENVDRIDAIKIDVEGMEYQVMQGGKLTLEKYHPIIYFETLPIFFHNKSYTIQTIYEFLASLDYQIIYPTKPYAPIPFNGAIPANSVAIHSSRVDRLN